MFKYGVFEEKPLEPKVVGLLTDSGREKLRALMRISILEVVDVLHQVGQKWQKGGAYFEKALAALPPEVGFSPPMVTATLEMIPDLLRRETLLQRLDSELGTHRILDEFVARSAQAGRVRAFPLGVLLHVAAGNIFLGCIDSLVMGFLTKNISILKLSSRNQIFPQLFAQSLLEVDQRRVLADKFCILHWSSHQKDIEETFKQTVDGVLAWGGAQMLESYRQGLGPQTKLFEFGPKISMQVLFKAEMERSNIKEVGKRIAREVSLWDQNACASPQNLFFEKGIAAQPLMDAIAAGLCAYPHPRGELSDDENVEIWKEKYRGKVSRFEENGLDIAGDDFYLHYDPRPMLRPSPLNRTLILKAFIDLDDLCGQLKGAALHLQSCSYLASGPTKETLLLRLGEIGVRRFAPLGEILEGRAGAPHDGRFVLADLVDFVGDEALGGSTMDGVASSGGSVKSGVEFPSGPVKTGVEFSGGAVKTGLEFSGGPAKQAVGPSAGKPAHDGYYSKGRQTQEDDSSEKGQEQAGKWRWVPKETDQIDFINQVIAHVPYYRDIRQGQPVSSLDELPLTDGDLFARYPLTKTRALLDERASAGLFFSSGGTSGIPKYSFYTHEEFDLTAAMLAQSYQAQGLLPGELVANLFAAGNLWSSFLVVEKALEKCGVMQLPIGGLTEISTIVSYLQQFKPQLVVGLPSLIVSYANYCAREKIDLQVPAILYAGEHLNIGAQELLRRVWGTTSFRSAGYASVDAGPIGYQCAYCAPGEHHLFQKDVHLEVIDDEAVVTSKIRRALPVIRYRTGDQVALQNQKNCPCGSDNPKFMLLGRLDGMMNIWSCKIPLQEIEQCFSQLRLPFHTYQVELSETASGDTVEEHLKLTVEHTDPPALPIAELKKHLYAACHDLSATHPFTYFAERCEIDFVNEGKIERVKRTGKVKPIVDKRRRN